MRTPLFKASLKVLHIAPEPSLERPLRALPKLDYLTADLFSPSAMEKWDLTAIPYEAGRFDVVLCSHVLEHIVDDRKAMAEIYRVLTKGGWAILQVPIKDAPNTFEDLSITTPEARERIFGQSDHVRIYGRDYEERLKRAGFVVTVDDFSTELGRGKISKHCLHEDEKIYYCEKN